MKQLTPDQLERICEAHLFNLPYFRGMLRAVEDSLVESLDLPDTLLDLGAGDGHFAEAALRGKVLVGVDPWLKPMLEARSRGVYGLLVQADGHHLPLPDECIPGALSNSVLEHIPDIQGVLQEVSRVLKPGGVFVFTVPNQRFRSDLWGMLVLNKLGLKRLARRYEKFFNRIARHVNLEDPTKWVERLRQAGFADVEFRHYFPVWAMRMLERGHAAGLPNLVWKKMFNKWVLFKTKANPFIHFRKIEALVNNPFSDEGTCTIYVARRAD